MNTALNTAFYSRTLALVLGAAALFGGSFTALPAQAQTTATQTTATQAAADKTVTLNLVNTSLPNALRQLFKNAGITDYTIAPDVQGLTTLTVQDVPVRVALDAVLRSATPAAVVTVENGAYTVSRKAATNTPESPVAGSRLAGVRTASASGAAGTGAHSFDVIPVNKYDAYMIAVLMGAQGITPIPANDVVSAQQIAASQASANSQQNGAQNGQQNGRGNGGGGYGGGGGGGRGRRNRGGGGGYYGG